MPLAVIQDFKASGNHPTLVFIAVSCAENCASRPRALAGTSTGAVCKDGSLGEEANRLVDLGLLEHRAGPTGIAAERSGRLSSARQQAKGDESGCDKGLHCQFPIAFFKCAQRPSLSDVKLGMESAEAKWHSRSCDRTCGSRELGEGLLG